MHKLASTDELMERWRAGDEAAATEIYDRYARRLLELASAQMGDKLHWRVTADDIVQSALRTFIRRIDQWELQSDRSAAIWPLLVRITVQKIRKHEGFHSAQPPNGNAKVPTPNDDLDPSLVAHDPTPLEAAAFVEELEDSLSVLNSADGEILELTILGYTATEVAARIGCSRWTVRRTLDRIGRRLKERLDSDDEE